MKLFNFYKPKVGGALLLAVITMAGQLLGALAWIIQLVIEGLIRGERPAYSLDSMNMLLVYVVSFIPVAFFIWRRSVTFKNRGEVPVPLNAPQFGSLKAIVTVVLVAVLTLCLIVLMEPLESILPESDTLEQIFNMLRQHPVNTALSVCIAAPILEEIVCRGYMMRGMLQYIKPWQAIVISAFLFAVIHGNLAQGVTAFILGILLGWVYYRTGSLLMSMMIHFIVNTSSTIMALIPSIPEDASLQSIMANTHPECDYYLLLGFCAVLLVAIVWILHKNLPSSTSLKPLRPDFDVQTDD